ncbi:uncharacterized protein LOC142537599 [Primulina tabacum]|uniref:uncharacterized protein LOC142537599 n=1 Tax=Primulina tabacum TaxID=48773 RepID=UPI003F5AA4DC
MTCFFEQQFQQAPRPHHEVYDQFCMLGPKEFSGATDPFAAEGWIRSLEVHFCYLNMRDAYRVRCATYMLRDDASLWWEGAEDEIDLAALTWARFKGIFCEYYFTTDVRVLLYYRCPRTPEEGVHKSLPGDTTIAEFVNKFDRGCHFVPLIARDVAEN